MLQEEFLSVFRDFVLEAVVALVGFPYGVVGGVGCLGKPQEWFVVAGWGVLVLGPAILVEPDDLAPVSEAEVVE